MVFETPVFDRVDGQFQVRAVGPDTIHHVGQELAAVFGITFQTQAAQGGQSLGGGAGGRQHGGQGLGESFSQFTTEAGDGGGVLFQMPDAFFRRETPAFGVDLPQPAGPTKTRKSRSRTARSSA